jgi:hypothetical protein
LRPPSLLENLVFPFFALPHAQQNSGLPNRNKNTEVVRIVRKIK